MSRILTRLLLAISLLSWTLPAGAQTPVLDPRYAEFNASADHSATTPTGQPMVTRYDLEFYFAGAQAPFQTNSLGKPTPDSNGVIRVDLNSVLTAFPPPGTTYEARVTAIGPTGIGRSDVSNPFAFSDPCAITISPTGTSVGPTASTGTVSVTAGTGCSWTAVSNASWITLTGGSSGSGNGTVTYSVAANTSTSSRSGTLTIAGQTFTVTQAGACVFTISPTSLSISSSARTGSVTVTAGDGCSWTASSPVSWITITGGATGTGNGTVNYSIAANTSINQRSAVVTIAGLAFTVTQAGVPCTATLTPGGVSVGAGATTGTISVAIPAGCSWTASDNASWITITSGSSGNGNGTVAYSISANPNTTARNATITVAGVPFNITQAGVICSFTVSPTSSSPTHAGGSGTITVTANAASCGWTATSNASWITITSGSNGTGNGTVSFTVAPNTATSPRSGTLTVAGQQVTVNQAAAPCTYAIAPTQASIAAEGSTNTISVTAPSGCSWTASESSSWISITSGASGSGNGTVTYNVTANPGITTRSATMTVAGQPFSVTQAGQTCTYELSPPGVSVGAGSSNGTVALSTIAGCPWIASSSASWITVTSATSGNGPATISYSVGANGTTSPRTGALMIGGEPFTVTQAGGSCSYSVSPSSESFGAAGGSESISVTAQSGCTWTATADASWITITSGGSGNGNGTIQYQVAANPVATPRNATIAVGGRVVTISQAAASCSYTLSPSSVSIDASAATGSFSVATLQGCSWTASSSASWLTLTGSTSGNGSGTVTYSAAANTSGSARSATISVGGRTFTVQQAAPVCSFTLSTTSLSVQAGASTGTVTVTAGSGCSWSATSNRSWITITGGSSGNGNGTVTLSIAANTSTTARNGSVTIAGQTVSVSQAGVPCSTSISPTSVSASSDTTAGTIAVTSGAGCGWSATSNVSWITINSGSSGTGNGTVSYSVAANPGASARSGHIIVGGQTFVVNQDGRSCTFSIDPSGVSVGAGGTTQTIAVTATSGCSWTASSNASWITVTGGASGSGNGTVTFSVAANTGTVGRSGTITVAGHQFSVSQAGACNYSLSPLALTVGTSATSSTVRVFAASGCAWTAVSEATWITVTSSSSGSGNGTVTLAIAANSGGAPRAGAVTIAGQTFTVNQSGCTYNVSPSSASVGPNGAVRSAFINTAGSCSWSASSNASWITLPSNSGSGTAWLTYNVAANTSTSSRTGTLTIAGRTLTVNQDGAACTYQVSPTSVIIPMGGGTAQVSVTTSAGCSWSVTNNSAWVTVLSGQTGTGSGTVTLQAPANPTSVGRTTSLTIAGRLVFVSQQVVTQPNPPSNLRIVIP